MELKIEGFTFFSTFDSGNLANVEPIHYDSHPLEGQFFLCVTRSLSYKKRSKNVYSRDFALCVQLCLIFSAEL